MFCFLSPWLCFVYILHITLYLSEFALRLAVDHCLPKHPLVYFFFLTFQLDVSFSFLFVHLLLVDPSIMTSTGKTECVIYYEELKDDNKSAAELCVCGMAVYLHGRKPSESPLSSSQPVASRSGVNKDFLKSLPKWRKDYHYCREFLLRFEQVCTAADLPAEDWTKQLIVSVPDVQESAWITKHIVAPQLNWKQASVLFTRVCSTVWWPIFRFMYSIRCPWYRHSSHRPFSEWSDSYSEEKNWWASKYLQTHH